MRGTGGQQHLGAALKLLSQTADLYLPGRRAAQPGRGHCPDISAEPDFWFILRCALVRASYLLHHQEQDHTSRLHHDCVHQGVRPACPRRQGCP